MATEYAVFTNSGVQLGIPARSFGEPAAAQGFFNRMESARQDSAERGRLAAEALSSAAPTAQGDLQEEVARGKLAGETSYVILQREVGPWVTLK